MFLLEYDEISIMEDGSIQKFAKEWVLETDGVDLKAVMCNDGLDCKRTFSNSCVEVFGVLGIEAAGAIILEEMRNVIQRLLCQLPISGSPAP